MAGTVRERRARTVTRAEARLWREVVRDAQPLPGRAVPAEDDAPPPVPAPSAEPAERRPAPAMPPPPQARALPHLTHGHSPGVDARNAERLRRGQLSIEARIDLHGMTQDAAHAALVGFVARGYDAGRRCVLVITGKGLREGTGVLRAAVPRWLNEPRLRGMILAFSHAQPRDGGEGALYVLLKRKR